MEQLPIHLFILDPQENFIIFVINSILKVYNLKNQHFIETKDLKENGHKGIIRCIKFNNNSNLFISCGDDKTIKIWDVSNWNCILTKNHNKKILNVEFGNYTTKEIKDTIIIFSDKFGDVFSFSLSNISEQILLLGHCSTITCLIMSLERNYLITSDRDEKIRVSHYPNTYIIERFCFGHTRLIIPNKYPNLLLSGSGDGTLRIWNYLEGILYHTEQVVPDNGKNVISSISYSIFHDIFAVLVEGLSKIFFYAINIINNKPILYLKQILVVHCLPFHLLFDKNGLLWVGGKNPLLQIFQFDKEKDEFFLDNSLITPILLDQLFIEVNEKKCKEMIEHLSLNLFRKKEFIYKQK